MNVLVNELSKELKKVNLGIIVKKETNTILRCYLYDLNDCIKNGIIKNYTDCKKLDVDYKKTDLVKLRDNHTMNNFAKSERKNYDMANQLNMLRKGR